MEKEHKILINLSPQKPVVFTNVFFNWAIRVGRIIIILTELVALGALFYRFIVDRQVIDLHDQIRQGLLVVSAQSKQEEIYRDLQNRLLLIKSLTEQTQQNIITTNNILNRMTALGGTVSRFSLQSNTLLLQGEFLSVSQMSDLLQYLGSLDAVSSANVETIQSKGQIVDFEMRIEFKK
jgi:hypothetical protein